MRIGIIGAGISGLATAWLLAEEHRVVVWERRGEVGGHARTSPVGCCDVEVPVDTGFQHFSTAMYPCFVRLLEILGVATVPSPVTCTVVWSDGGRALRLTPTARPGELGGALRPAALSWLLQLRSAVVAGARVEDFQQTVGEYLDGLLLGPRFKQRFLLPFLTALLGTSLADARRMSARAALRYPVAHQPAHPLRPFEFLEVAGGVRRYLAALRRELPPAEVRTGAEVVGLEPLAGGWGVREEGGRRTPVDQVVLATPADRAARLLADLPGHEGRRADLGRVEYLDTTIAVHSDARYMPPARPLWAGYNIAVSPRASEGTLWSGRRQDLPVFKSWVTHRGTTPGDLHLACRFRHPLMTPEYYRVQDRLARRQGEAGLWLAGSYLADIDSHESGLRSAMAVAARLGPRSPRLADLAGRAARRAALAVG